MMKLLLAVVLLLTEPTQGAASRLRAAHIQLTSPNVVVKQEAPPLNVDAQTPLDTTLEAQLDVPSNSAVVNATAAATAPAATAPAATLKILTDAEKDDGADDADDADADVQEDDKATEESRPAANADDHKLDVDHIEQSLAKLSGAQGKATPGMMRFVNMTKTMMEKDMKPKILDAHRKDGQLLNSFKNSFRKCKTGRLTAAATMITLKKTRSRTSTFHKTCRKKEAAAYKIKDRCDTLLDAKQETQKAACDALKDLTRNPSSEANKCHSARSEDYASWLDRNEKYFIAKNKEFKMHQDKCANATAEVNKQKPVCRKDTRRHVAAKAACDVKQITLETAACNLAKKMSQTCHSFNGCYSSTKRGYIKAKPGIKKQARDRKGEWRVLMRVECLLDVFAADDGKVNETAIGVCKNTTHDTTHLDLVYPPIPPKEACKPMPPIPGSNAFKQVEYSSLPKNAEAADTAMCVVEAGGGIELGAPKGVPAAQCSMAGGGFLKAAADGSCLISDVDGKPVKVDYTKNMYTTYKFTMKFDGDPGNYNRMPLGGFMPCNVDRNSYRRGGSPQLNFFDRRGYWGYTYVNYPHTYRRYQSQNWLKRTRAYPKSGKELKWEVTMQYRSNRKLYVYSWKVNGVPLVRYNNYVTRCWNNGRHHAFTPRIWAKGATKGVYIKDFRVFQGLVPLSMPQIIGTGIPKSSLKVACAERGKMYKGRGIPRYGRWYTRNEMNCQKRCEYLSGCDKFTYYPDGWCYFFQAGYRRYKAPRNVVSGPPTCQSPKRSGLRAEFFYYKKPLARMPSLLNTKPDMQRIDSVVWYANTGAPWAGLKQRDQFAARWTGSIIIKKGGTYRFDITSDDASFLWIDGRVVIGNPGLHAARTIYRNTRLKPGWHSIMLTMFENHAAANMFLKYRGPDTDYHHTLVPAEMLRPSKKNAKYNTGPFYTPNNKGYYKYPDQAMLLREGSLTYLLATVRAKNDVHLGLYPSYLEDPVPSRGKFYEIVIGGWGDQRSTIRRGGQEKNQVFPHTRNIVSKYEYRSFWISANRTSGEVAVGRGHDITKYKFMEWKDPEPLDIKSFAVMTGWGGTGEWIFESQQRGASNKRRQKFSKIAWFLGDKGQDCTQICAEKGRVCDSTIANGFDYNSMRMYVKENLGVTCEKDTRRWWAHDQPGFVADGPDANQNKCLAYSQVPAQVRCDAKHPRVMRWCKCSQTTMVPHFQRQGGNDRTWVELNATATARGGRLMTLAEARLYLEQKGKIPLRPCHDDWAAVANPAAPSGKDWIQLNGRRKTWSHVERYGYPRWGDSKKRGRWCANMLMWTTERKR